MATVEAVAVPTAPGSRPYQGSAARGELRRRLEELRATHTVHLARIDGQVVMGLDPDDEHVLRTQSSLKHWLLDEIEDAIRRLDHGSYGCCEDCGVAISPGRLEIIPYARRCLVCQAQERPETD